MRRSPLRPRSKKTAAKYVQRRRLVVQMLDEFPWCARCYWSRAVDLHELKNRSQGGDLLDPDQIVTLCRQCHQWVTENPKAAHDTGWTFWSHETPVKPSGCECGKPVPFDGGAEGVCECCSTCSPTEESP